MASRSSRLFAWALPLLAASASCGHADSGDAPTRPCGIDVWYKPASQSAVVYVVGSWNGFARPGTALPDLHRDDGFRHAHVDVDGGTYRYFLVDDGARVLDTYVPTTTFETAATRGLGVRDYGGQATTPPEADDEVNVLDVGSCAKPLLQIEKAEARSETTARVEATFLAASSGVAVDPATVRLRPLGDGATATPVSVDPATGALHFNLTGLQTGGKARFLLEASDVAGVPAVATPVSIWLEPEVLAPEDWTIYQVMVDRFRQDDGTPSAPAEAGGRAGGNLQGVLSAVRDGTFERLGVRALWLSPLYDNPDGFFPGEPGRRYSSYHGYWPKAARSVEENFGTEADVAELVRETQARGMRILFDLVPNHVHTEHPYFSARTSDAVFNGTDGTCVCGSPECPWDQFIQTCWFAPYLPDNNGRLDQVAQREAADATWWLERFGADGLRIDAVPMMTRALTRRIVWGARDRLQHPGHPLFFLGETFTGAGGYGDIKYQLGPQGLSSQFHFPLMWALRGAVATEGNGLDEIDRVLAESSEQFRGSGAVLGTMIGNHDVTRFASESAGTAGGDGWTPAPDPTDPEVFAKQAFALGLVFALPGAPVIYYGDEIGLAGARDPDSRRVFPAELSAAQAATRTQVEAFGRLRKCSAALRRGDYETITATPESLVFTRETAGSKAIVVANRAPRTAAPLQIPPGTYRDALTGAAFAAEEGSLSAPAGGLVAARVVASRRSMHSTMNLSRLVAVALLSGSTLVGAAACGDQPLKTNDTGTPPDASGFDPGKGGGTSGGYGYGNGTSSGGPSAPECPDELKKCAVTFTYPYNGETSVELRGDYRGPDSWLQGDPLTRSGSNWVVTVPVTPGQPVLYKYCIDGCATSDKWVPDPDPAIPQVDDGQGTGGKNSQRTDTTCTETICDEPPLPPAGVFDWRDSVMYFVFVDRFQNGNPANDCNVSGVTGGNDSPGNYQGGDWAGVTQKIEAGYFTDLGVNTLWLTVPVDNTNQSGKGSSPDTNDYSAYHGYWPAQPRSRIPGELLRHVGRPAGAGRCRARQEPQGPVRLRDGARALVQPGVERSPRLVLGTRLRQQQPLRLRRRLQLGHRLQTLLVHRLPAALELHERRRGATTRWATPWRGRRSTASTASASTPSNTSKTRGSPTCARRSPPRSCRCKIRRSASTWSVKRSTGETATT